MPHVYSMSAGHYFLKFISLPSPVTLLSYKMYYILAKRGPSEVYIMKSLAFGQKIYSESLLMLNVKYTQSLMYYSWDLILFSITAHLFWLKLKFSS